MRWLWLMMALSACARSPGGAGGRDLAVANPGDGTGGNASADLAAGDGTDLGAPSDMRPADMRAGHDLAASPDMMLPDMAPAPDMTMPRDMTPAPDMTMPRDMLAPPDMTAPPDLAQSPTDVVVHILIDNFCNSTTDPTVINAPLHVPLNLTFENDSNDYDADVWSSRTYGYLGLAQHATWHDPIQHCLNPTPYTEYFDVGIAGGPVGSSCPNYRLDIHCN